MFNKTAKISDNKFRNVLNLIKHSKKFEKNLTNTNSSESSSFYDYYFLNFAKNKVFITIRDIVEYVFLVVVAFYFKNKYQGFIKASLKVNILTLNISKDFETDVDTINQEKAVPQNCNFTKECINKHCPCKRMNRKCNSACHNGLLCQNKENFF